ncbi:MAG: FliA/WhiG family RNA polymerase sigma factor [bacterium]|nr:FliA/WhiG family RNA polymerase sigma factor [bacterium]
MPKHNNAISQYKATQSPKAKEEEIKKWIPFVRWIANRFALYIPTVIEMEDVISQGIIGLIKAIDSFDPARGVAFKTYAFHRIRGAILDGFRALDWKSAGTEEKIRTLEITYAKLSEKLHRMPTEDEVAAALGITKEKFYKLLEETRTPQLISLDLSQDEDGTSSEESIASKEPGLFSIIQEEERKENLLKMINELPEKSRLLITLYYYEDLTYKEIAKTLDLSESRVCQLHTEIILYFKKVLKKVL